MGEKARVAGVAGGAVGLAGFAAALGLCCTVPWAVALLGVSGAVAFARLTFLAPYSVLGAVLLLGVGFWLAYRPSPGCAEPVCTPKARRLLRSIVWVAAALVGVLTVLGLRYQMAL
jgi:hypothetical protein